MVEAIDQDYDCKQLSGLQPSFIWIDIKYLMFN